MKKGKIYALVCPKDKKIKYVGLTQLTLPKRLNNHWQGVVRAEKEGKLFNRKDLWLKSLKDEGLSCEIVLLEECSVDRLGEREVYWIKELKKVTELLNFSDGGLIHTEEVRNKISESRKGERNPNFGKRHKRTPEQIEKARVAMVNSEKFQTSRKSKEFRELVSKRMSDPVLVLDDKFQEVAEFANATKCAEHYGYTRGNIKNACRDLRPIGTRTEGTLNEKRWVVRKRLKTESIKKIKEKEEL